MHGSSGFESVQQSVGANALDAICAFAQGARLPSSNH